MIISMRRDATDPQIDAVVEQIRAAGCDLNIDRGTERTVIGVRTGRHDLAPEVFAMLPGVDEAVRINKPYKLASREYHPAATVVDVAGVKVGDGTCCVIAGPCSIESPEQMMATAQAVKKAGARILRGGAYKPRSSPYAFQGMGEEGLKLLADAGRATGLPVVTEVLHLKTLDSVAAHADLIQIGARNMQNYDLLREVAALRKPVFLKRGLSATIEEMLLSAEYLLAGGTSQVIFCERGIRTFETATRNTLDIAAVPVLKARSHLPVAVDPSHAGGYRALVADLALAGLAVGADALMIEVHPDPAHAKCDGPQSLDCEQFAALMDRLRPVAKALGRSL